MRRLLTAAFGALALALAGPAIAELVEYRTPDGRTGYTNDPARLPPGARIVSAREESAASPPATPAAAPPAPGVRATPAASHAESANAESDAEAEWQWRERKASAAGAVDQARRDLASAERLYSDCRGRENYWNARYAHSPVDSSCDDEGDRLEAARERLAEAEAYLADGLFEDCRRSGCLPGWVR
jgi:hypothetical protein